MQDNPLLGKTILITGAARRLGRLFALACARHGADVIIHHGHSPDQATQLQVEIRGMGRRAEVIQSDLSDPEQVARLVPDVSRFGQLDALVNNAAIFEPLTLLQTDRVDWERHLAINLTAPLILSQAFARQRIEAVGAHIVNILDWRALRPGADHFPYTITKSALAAVTKAMAAALAPRITVNGLALGAVLPPTDRSLSAKILDDVPLGRWAQAGEVERALIFLLTEPTYVTGEIIHVDGGRHLI